MIEAPHGTIEVTGASSNSLLVGVAEHNRGLVFKVYTDQAYGDGGPVTGYVEVLEGGSGPYAALLEEFQGYMFPTAARLIQDLQAKGAEGCDHILDRNALQVYEQAS